jgi:hypothetical protein
MSSRALTELFRGKGAHADPVACVEDLSAELASRQVKGFPHSIAQLVFHMNYWMDYELRRIRGERPAYPEHASESFPAGFALRWTGMGPSEETLCRPAGGFRRRWRILLRKKCSARSKVRTQEICRSRQRSRLCSGRWWRTTVTTRARSQCCGRCWEPGRHADGGDTW